MKQLLLLIFLITGNFLFSQNYYTISFEGTGVHENNSYHKLYIDTISNPNNSWQIGVPQKTFLPAHLQLPMQL